MPSIYSYFFKRRPQREFLIDRYKPKKSKLVVFLQGLVFIVMLLVLGIFILLLSNQAFADTPFTENYFLTDARIGNESTLFEVIHNRLGNSRLFTVGIGSYFMHKATQFGRGSFTYIGDINDVHEKMSALFKKLNDPLMTHIKLSFDDISESKIMAKAPALL